MTKKVKNSDELAALPMLYPEALKAHLVLEQVPLKLGCLEETGV